MACKFPCYLKLPIPFVTFSGLISYHSPFVLPCDFHWPPCCLLNTPSCSYPRAFALASPSCSSVISQGLFFSLLLGLCQSLERSPFIIPYEIAIYITYRNACPYLHALFFSVALDIYYTLSVWFLDCLLSPAGCNFRKART